MPYVGPTRRKGRGVFAEKRYRVGDILETAPVIVMSEDDFINVQDTVLYGYIFGWGDNECALALGAGSLYNHSYTPNARYEHDHDNMTIQYIAIRPIKKSEEICINYNGDPEDKSPLHFDVAE